MSEKEVLKLVVKYLGLNAKVSFKPSRREMTDFETRMLVWNFWHDNSSESTNTTDLTRLLITARPQIQEDLPLMSSVCEVVKRNRSYFQSIWKTVTKTYAELHQTYNNTYPTNKVSYGTFFALKPFYVHHASDRDLVMCCCKLHLHARWSIKALISLLTKQEIAFPPQDYDGFFNFLYEQCTKEEYTYICWECTPDRKLVCSEIMNKWNILKAIANESPDDETVLFTEFQNLVKYDTKGEPIKDKKGEIVKRLTPVQHNINATYLISFIEDLLPVIIHHRNHLKHYRSTIKKFTKMMNPIYLDIDFAENLTLGMKFEPQSLHWVKIQITVHSGILKFDMFDKQYHPYISDSRVHDQAFVKLVLVKMLDSVTIPEGAIIIIESDNCSSQYKSAHHFQDIQDLANKYGCTIIRVFGIAGHGKGEVDHVGGVAKVAVRQEIARGYIYTKAHEICEYLHEKFGKKTAPVYHCHEMKVKQLEEERQRNRYRKFDTVEGSSSFHVMVFQPNSQTFRASPRLCVCDSCVLKPG